MKKGSSSNSFPKTFSFNFSPTGCTLRNVLFSLLIYVHPVGLKLILKVFGRGFGGDSPQCGEMSAKLTEGTGDRWENLSSERFPPINTYKSPIEISVLSYGNFLATVETAVPEGYILTIPFLYGRNIVSTVMQQFIVIS